MDLICIPFAFPGVPRVRCAFQTRLVAGKAPGAPTDFGNVVFVNGDFDDPQVLANRQALQRQLGFGHWQECRQVHGDAMLFDAPPTGWQARVILPEADGMATRQKGVALVIKTADCQPVLLTHAAGEHVAALHVGWRGNRVNFPGSAVRRFCARYDLAPDELLAVRGPSLGPAASEFVNFKSEWGTEFQDYFDPVARTMDLWRLTREQLVKAGLRPERIFSLDCCTRSLHHQFFSHRQDKESGRQANCIWIEE
jgi:polyphenol oxidase